MLTKFPNRGWTLSESSSGCPRNARKNDNIEYVEEETLSQQANPSSHSSPAETQNDWMFLKVVLEELLNII